MFAGVTARVSADNPHPAERRVRRHRRQAAPANSMTPLTSTVDLGQGIQGGTMRITRSVATK